MVLNKFNDLTLNQLKKIVKTYNDYIKLETTENKTKKELIKEIEKHLYIEKGIIKIIKPDLEITIKEKEIKTEIKEPQKRIKPTILNEVYITNFQTGINKILQPLNFSFSEKSFNEIKEKGYKIFNFNMVPNHPILKILEENKQLLNRIFNFDIGLIISPAMRDNLNKIYFYLLSFQIYDNKIIFNGWSIYRDATNHIYLSFLNGIKGGGTTQLNFYKNLVKKRNVYLKLSSVETRATIDFYKKMGFEIDIKELAEDLNFYKNPSVINKIKTLIKIKDYDLFYTEITKIKNNTMNFARLGDYFYYFPSEKIRRSFNNVNFINLVSGQEYLTMILMIIGYSKEEAIKIIQEKVDYSIKTKGKLEGSGMFY
jgi:hypothetical protein